MRHPIPLIVAACLVLGGCAQLSSLTAAVCTPAATPDPGAYVRGRVTGPDGAPAEAAEVTLADAAGQPIPGLMRARSDAQGDFLAAQVPPGHAYVMTATFPDDDGKPVVLKTLVEPGTDPNAYQDLSVASTIVATALTQGKSGLPGDFDAQAYQDAVAHVDAALGIGAGPDLADPLAIVAWLNARRGEDSSLAASLDLLDAQVSRIEPRAAVEAQLPKADPDPLDALKPVY